MVPLSVLFAAVVRVILLGHLSVCLSVGPPTLLLAIQLMMLDGFMISSLNQNTDHINQKCSMLI